MIDLNQKWLVIAFITAAILYFTYPNWLVRQQPTQAQAWGSQENQPYMTIVGQKPTDTKVSAQVYYFGRGESCSGWSWSASSGEVIDGNLHQTFQIEHNFSTDPNRYELRVPYQTQEPEKDCLTHLSRMEVTAKNNFDTVGFATLRIHKAGDNYYNKPISLNSKIEAKNCEPYYSEEYKRWTNGFGCYYYIDKKKKSKDQEFNAETVYFDFSQFNDNTVINYDIIAGKDYRTEPLDPKTGK